MSVGWQMQLLMRMLLSNLKRWMIQKLKMLFTVILPLERAVCAALLAQEPTV